MIMIVKTHGSQMDSPAAAEGGGKAMGRGRRESGERSEVQARLTLTSTAPKARSRSREGATQDEAPMISLKVSLKIPSLPKFSLRYGGNRTHAAANPGLLRSQTLTTRPTVYIRLVPNVPIRCDGNIRYQSYIHGLPSG